MTDPQHTPSTSRSERPSAATLAHLETMVGIDTTSRTSNFELLRVIETELDRYDIPHQRVLDTTRTKASLLARIGPNVDGGVVLTGHTDCVPVEGQPWSTDPFQLHERDGRLYGRGTCDMKGFLAVVLAALPSMAHAQLARPIQLVLTYDEEVGTAGAPDAVDALLASHPRPTAVIVGEPTDMIPIVGHKGIRTFTTTVEGVDGHSSQPHLAANAIAALSRIATFIDDLAARHRAAGADTRFDPPHTTFNLATIRGGQAINIVPRHAELTWEYRPVPADDSFDVLEEVERFAQEEVLPQLRETTGVGAIVTTSNTVSRGLDIEVDSAAERLVRTLTDYQGPGTTVPFATDGGHFQAAGLSTVVCGPGSIEQAHQPDEWITLGQLARAERLVDQLIDHLALPPADPTDR